MAMIRLNATAAIPARYANRHGIITGPTGTGKTVTLQTLIESLAQAGVSVYTADVKGDLAALQRSCNVSHLQPLSGHGKPLRVPVWSLGADLLSRALELTDAQSGALEIAFAYAEEIAAPLDSLSDFRALLSRISAATDSVSHLGHVTRASIGTIQRALLRLDNQWAGYLFGAPGFDVADLLTPGLVSILDASALYHAPRLYGALMLYVLRQLATRLPEAGDLDKPRLVLIFDEAHTLFHEASPALLRSIEATARLIRSKGVGLYFASQSPQDIPQVVREQCATAIAHSRDYGVGWAMFQTLDSKGQPTAPRMIRPDLPQAPLGALQDHEKPRAHSPAMPRPVQQAAIEPVNMDSHGYAFLGVMAVVCMALGAWLF